MIELNLLPKELRKKKKVALPEIPILPIAIGVVCVLVVLQVILFGLMRSRKTRLRRLEKKWEQLEPQRKVINKVITGIKATENHVKVIKDIAAPEVDWAELLSGLNQSMIPNVWLSEFKPVFKKPQKGKKKTGLPTSLDLTGYGLGSGEIATATVAKFIDSLKKTEEFSKFFDDIELQNMHKQTLDGEEVMRFKLICTFKTKEEEPIKGKKKRR